MPEAAPARQSAANAQTPTVAAPNAAQKPEPEQELAILEQPEAQPAEPGSGEIEKPSFDIVRVDPDGQAVVAGRSEPGWHVAVKINGETKGQTVANDRGEWVWVTKDPIKPGSSEITIEARPQPAAPPLASRQAVDVVVSDTPGKQALVVLSEASRPSRVMQSPEEQPQAGSPKVALAPPGETATTAAEVPEKAAKPGAEPAKRPVSLEVVDYDDTGEIIFSGRGSPGATVRLYVDNNPVGDASVDGQGAWTLSGRGRIAPGQHALRVDELGSGAKVESRVELPFVRAKPAEVAALASPAEKSPAASTPAARSGEPAPPASSAAKPAEQQMAAAPAPAPEIKPEATPKSDKLANNAVVPPAMTGAGSASPATNSAAQVEPPATKLTEIPPKPQTTSPSPSAPQQPPAPEQPAVTQQPPAAEQPAVTQQPPAPEQPAVTQQPPAAPQPPATQEASKAQEPPQPEQQAMSNGAALAGLPEAATGGEPAAKAQVAEAPRPRNGRVVIQPGNNLWNISRVIYGKGTRYTVIYRANKDLIRSPRLIYPGQIFATPGSVPPVSIDPSWRKPLAEIVGDGTGN